MGWREISKAGRDAFHKGAYDGAERLLSAALMDAQKLGKADPRLAISLNDLGMFYHSLGRLTEAEPLYRKAIAIDEKRGGEAGVDIAVTLENLAELYKSQQRKGEAVTLSVSTSAVSMMRRLA